MMGHRHRILGGLLLYITGSTRTSRVLLWVTLFAGSVMAVSSCDSGTTATSTPATVTPTASEIATPTPTIVGDGTVDTAKLYHDFAQTLLPQPGRGGTGWHSSKVAPEDGT